MHFDNLTNYHNHTLFCDGRADMEDFVRFAVSKGYSSFGFSSHAPLPFPTAWTMEWDRMDDYLQTFHCLKQQYSEKLELCIGLEIDYLDENHNPSAACFQHLPLDYRIGSIHLLADANGVMHDADLPADAFCQMVEHWFEGDVKRVVTQYYERSFRMNERGGFDIVGHPGKIQYNACRMLPGLSESVWYDTMVHEYLADIVQREYIVEINTKAYHDLGVFYPDERYFSYLHQLGARVQVNSDAHYPDRISYGRLAALEALARAGFVYVTEWHGGQWQDVKLRKRINTNKSSIYR